MYPFLLGWYLKPECKEIEGYWLADDGNNFTSLRAFWELVDGSEETFHVRNSWELCEDCSGCYRCLVPAHCNSAQATQEGSGCFLDFSVDPMTFGGSSWKFQEDRQKYRLRLLESRNASSQCSSGTNLGKANLPWILGQHCPEPCPTFRSYVLKTCLQPSWVPLLSLLGRFFVAGAASASPRWWASISNCRRLGWTRWHQRLCILAEHHTDEHCSCASQCAPSPLAAQPSLSWVQTCLEVQLDWYKPNHSQDNGLGERGMCKEQAPKNALFSDHCPLHHVHDALLSNSSWSSWHYLWSLDEQTTFILPLLQLGGGVKRWVFVADDLELFVPGISGTPTVNSEHSTR